MSMQMIRILLIVSLAAFLLVAHGVEVVCDGKLQFDGIVIRQNMTSAEKHAAAEMAYHLKKSTGQELPVIVEKTDLPKGNYIFIGDCEMNRKAGLAPAGMEKNHGTILAKDGNIHLAGKDDVNHFWVENTSIGTLFATYEFLEKYLGVRWLWPGELGEVIPEHRNLEIDDIRADVKPRVLSSLWRDSSFLTPSGWADQKNRQRFNQEQKIWLKRHRFNCDSEFQYGHAFTDYYQRYSKEHPEFFSLLPDGTRRSNPYAWSRGAPSCVSLCVTNPELIRTIVTNWQARNPRMKTINLNENDTGGECVCEACLAADNSPFSAKLRQVRAKRRFDKKEIEWENELGSLTDRYCQFYLTVQKEADKIDPNHRIMGLIYANYSKPPSAKIKLNERIILRFCPPYMYPWTDRKIKEYKETWSGWARSGAKLMFRPNFTLDGNYFPVQYQDVFYDLYTFSAERGMIAVDMDSLTGHYGAQGLVNYVIATLNHDRETPLNELENTFFTAFGAAGPQVREYFDYVKQISMKSGFKSPFADNSVEGGILYVDLFLVADTLFTPTVMEKCWSLLNAAAEAPDLDLISAQRVEFLKNGLKNTELVMAAQSEFRKYQKNGKIDSFAKAVRELDEFRASIESTNAVNMGNARYLEDRKWPSRASLTMIGKDQVQLTDWKIRFDPENTGTAAKWFEPGADMAGAADIKTDSHWSKQQIGQSWEKQHGRQYLGTGWYYNTFSSRPKNPVICFMAVDGTATIYLNGKQIHHRPYPFEGNRDSWKEPFRVTVPPELLKSKDNLLVIRVEKHEGQAGIWRPVHLVFEP